MLLAVASLWAWGVNGAMSVLGATLAIHVAMSYGFARVALYGAIIYAAAGLIGLWMTRRNTTPGRQMPV